MNIWFIAILLLYVLDLGFMAAKHGEKREGEHNFWIAIVVLAIQLFLIYMAIQTGF